MSIVKNSGYWLDHHGAERLNPSNSSNLEQLVVMFPMFCELQSICTELQKNKRSLFRPSGVVERLCCCQIFFLFASNALMLLDWKLECDEDTIPATQNTTDGFSRS